MSGGVFLNGRADRGEFVCVFKMPLLDVFAMIGRDGGDKEDAAYLLEALVRGINAAFPEVRKETTDAGTS